MKPLCNWKGFIVGERAMDAAQVLGRKYEFKPTDDFEVVMAQTYVEYRNLNREHRKYIDGLTIDEKVAMLDEIRNYSEDDILNDIFEEGKATHENLKPWLDNFPGLILNKPRTLPIWNYITADKKPHVFGTCNICAIKKGNGLVSISGSSECEISRGMKCLAVRNKQYAPYAMGLSDIAKNFDVEIAVKSIGTFRRYGEVYRVTRDGEYVEEKQVPYLDIVPKTIEDFSSEEDWIEYRDSCEKDFLNDI